MGSSLHIVDFLVQNMPSGGIDRTTIDGETALHLSARHDRAEAMKLLLRAGADPSQRNKQDKTPLDIAQEMGHHTCKELVIQQMESCIFLVILILFLNTFSNKHIFHLTLPLKLILMQLMKFSYNFLVIFVQSKHIYIKQFFMLWRIVLKELIIYFQLSHALQRQKTLFDNVNIDWNLSHDEGSTDFSDDETIIEDRVSILTLHRYS